MERILCLIDSLGSGGAQRQMVGLSVLLKKKGYDVKVVTYFDVPFHLQYLMDNGVENECLECGRSLYKRLSKINRSIKEFKADVVISYLDTPNILSCLLKLYPRKWKLIVSERSLTQQLNIRERIKFFLYGRADVIVPNSYSQCNFIKKHYPRLSSKCQVITNFVDTDYFSPNPLMLINESLKIIGVGRVNDEKNIPLLINAIKLVLDQGYNVKVSWYGRRYPIFTTCANLIKQLNIEDSFEFREPSTDIVKAYQNSDLFVLTSLYEGFSNVICEAMSCGLPVIASDVSDNGVLVKNGENGFLFPSNDKDCLAEKIIKYYNLDSEQKKEMGRNSRERALKMFSSELFIEKYIQLFDIKK